MIPQGIAKRLNRGTEQAVNPLDQAEMIRAVELAKRWSRAVNPKIKEKLPRPDTFVVGLGGIHSESLVAQGGLRFKSPYKIYNIDGVRSAASHAVNMSDQDFRNAYPKNQFPESQATNLCRSACRAEAERAVIVSSSARAATGAYGLVNEQRLVKATAEVYPKQ